MAQVADQAKSGLDPLFDPLFFLTDEQKELRQQLIEICERDIRPAGRLERPHVHVPAQEPRGARPVPRSAAAEGVGRARARAT